MGLYSFCDLYTVCNNTLILNTFFTLTYANAHGLVGIHGFYIGTGYNLLKNLVYKISPNTKSISNHYLYIIVDGIFILLPYYSKEI